MRLNFEKITIIKIQALAEHSVGARFLYFSSSGLEKLMCGIYKGK